MIIPLRTDSPLRSTPYMNYALIAANVVVFLAQLVTGLQTGPVTKTLQLNPMRPEVYCFIGYAFLHANILHILGNMLFLFIFGNNVNDKMGHVGYLAFYLAGGVFAGIGYVLTKQAAPVVGASGAIAAVTGAYLILFPRSSVTVLYFFYLIGQIEVPSLWFILFFFAQDIFLNFAGDSGVAHAAHIGGTMFGLAICLALLSINLLPRDQFDVVALIQRWNRRRQYRDIVSQGYNPFEYARRGTSPVIPPAFTPQMEKATELRGAISTALATHDMPTAAKLYLELRAVDPSQVLARQPQLDIANQLASEQQYPAAADAYEQFLRAYPNYEQVQQVDLMLGLIYARYLGRYARAKECLTRALTRLHTPRETELAREELQRIEPLVLGTTGV